MPPLKQIAKQSGDHTRSFAKIDPFNEEIKDENDSKFT
jgi:hypothetical protein